jgi:1-acyl-sn-glycerol-3-phosphate acyltransferase
MRQYSFIPSILQTLAWPFAHIIFNLSGSFRITGHEKIRTLKGPIIFAANHVNDLDPVLTRAMLPMFGKPLFWVARHKSFYQSLPKDERFNGWQAVIYGDWFFRAWGACLVPKGTGDYKTSLQELIQRVHDGYSVCVFPQGGAEKKLGRAAPVRGGVAFLAHHTGAPVVPLAISETLGLGPKELFFGRRKLSIRVGDPMLVLGDPQSAPDFYKNESEKIMDRVYALS